MKHIILSVMLLLTGLCVQAQSGIRNNGARIVVGNGATVHIQGADTAAHFTTDTNLVQLSGTVRLSGSWYNNGTQALNVGKKGTVWFDGTNTQYVGGNRNTTFGSLVTQGPLVLQQSVRVDSVLTFNENSPITLNNNNFTMGTSARLTGQNETSYFIVDSSGQFFSYVRNNGSKVFYPVGTSQAYMPVTLSNARTTVTDTTVSDYYGIRIFPDVTNNGLETGGDTLSDGTTIDVATTIGNTWVLNDSINGGSNLTVTVQWPSSENGSKFETDTAALAYYKDTAWFRTGASFVSGVNPYFLSRGALTYSDISLTVGSVLPFADATQPELRNVHIQSSNTIDTSYAGIGHTVILTFEANEPLRRIPSVSFALGKNNIPVGRTKVDDLGGNKYRATFVTQDKDPEGLVTFKVNFIDLFGLAGTTVIETSDETNVTFDKTAPKLSFSNMASTNNSPNTHAKDADTVFVEFTTNELLGEMPQVTLANQVATVTGDLISSKASYKLNKGDVGVTEGRVQSEIIITDRAGNVDTIYNISNIVSKNAIIADFTAPSIDTTKIIASVVSDNHTQTTVAAQNDAINLRVPVSETAILKLNGNTVAPLTGTINGLAGIKDTFDIAYRVERNDQDGKVWFKADIEDVAGNKNSVTFYTNIVIDRELPTASIKLAAAEICPGETTNASISFTGDAPWKFTYSINNNVFSDTATTSPFLVPINSSTILKVTSLQDNTNHFGFNLGDTAVVKVRTLPTPSFTMPEQIYYLDAPVVLPLDTIVSTNDSYSGNGVKSSGNNTYVFDPEAANYDTINRITYNLPFSSCQVSVSRDILVVRSVGINRKSGIVGFNYCYGDVLVDTLLGINKQGSTGVFKLYNDEALTQLANGLTDLNNNKAIFKPDSAYKPNLNYLRDTLWLQYSYISRNDTFSSPAYTIIIDNVGNAFSLAADVKPEYCIDNVPVTVRGENLPALNGNLFFKEITGVPNTKFFEDNKDNTALLTPAFTTKIDTVQKLKYYYRSSIGCVSDTLSQNIQINSLPEVKFNISNYCIADSIKFTNLTASSPNGGDILTWTFDGSTFETGAIADILYDKPGTKTVRLTVKSSKGCISFADTTFDVGAKPEADFVWQNECLSDVTAFSNLTTPVEPTHKYVWDFGDGNTDTLITPSHVYANDGAYNVKLLLRTPYGCVDSTIQQVNIRPVIDTYPYTQDFEAGNKGWVALPSVRRDSVSWQLGTTTKFNNSITSNAWVTKLTDAYNDDEHSYIEGPCFDFSTLDRPMIAFDMASKTQSLADGTAMQAFVGNEWVTVGSIKSGINWYNDFSINGQPGGQNSGWSGNIPWTNTRHQLDVVAKKEAVRIRFAFASNRSATDEGFAFDNVWIGNRTQNVIMETFVNANDNGSNNAMPIYTNELNKYPLDVIDLQYHTNFPKPDAIHQLNPSDPSARALYYGVGDVPYSIMDGNQFHGYTFAWNADSLQKRILQFPKFDIQLTDVLMTLNGKIQVNTHIKSLANISGREVNLRTAIVEGSDTYSGITHRNIIRRMLPDAAGYTYNRNWIPNDRADLITEGTLNNYTSRANLYAVVFLQDEKTKEIYQAVSQKVSDSLWTNAVTLYGQKDQQFIVYPNPAYKQAGVIFDKTVRTPYTIQVIGSNGILVQTLDVPMGSTFVELDVQKYAPGLYLVTLLQQNTVVGSQRLLVTPK